MEAYRGLVILTANLEGAPNRAFMRRLWSVLRLPAAPAQRRKIRQGTFPVGTTNPKGYRDELGGPGPRSIPTLRRQEGQGRRDRRRRPP
jgi:hypothetical protein